MYAYFVLKWLYFNPNECSVFSLMHLLEGTCLDKINSSSVGLYKP